MYQFTNKHGFIQSGDSLYCYIRSIATIAIFTGAVFRVIQPKSLVDWTAWRFWQQGDGCGLARDGLAHGGKAGGLHTEHTILACTRLAEGTQLALVIQNLVHAVTI